MQIQGINGINKKNTTFGMAVKSTPEAKKFLSEYLSRRGLKKFEKLAKFAENDSINVNLSTETRYLSIGMSRGSSYKQLIVDIDNQYHYEPEGMSFFIIRAIKKAVDKAHTLSEKQKTVNNIGL